MSRIDWAAGEGFVEIGGRKLEWASFGDAPDAKPTIVLLHEGLGCVALWRDFPQALANATGLGVFAYSRAGYGRSDAADLPRPLDYMRREAIEVLPPLLDAVGARRFILIGHSDGATIAALYAGGLYDARVRGLVLMAPHFFTEPMGLAAIRATKEAFDTGSLKANMAKYHRDPVATFCGWNDAWLDPAFTQWNVADVIDYLRIPALLIQGRQDEYGTLAQLREVESRSYAPVEMVLLDQCRHAPHLDAGAKTLAAIAAFTARLQRIELAEVEVG